MSEETKEPEPEATPASPEAAGAEAQAEAPSKAAPEPKADAAAPSAAEEATPSQEPAEEDAGDRRRGRGRAGRHIPAGVAHIKATFNNTMVAITDVQGGVIAWSTAGRAGFKGSRKSTAFAATLVGQDAARQAIGKGMNEVEVRVQGAGAGRESAIRALQSSGLNINVIKDVTPIPHNGCRPRKRRRV